MDQRCSKRTCAVVLLSYILAGVFLACWAFEAVPQRCRVEFCVTVEVPGEIRNLVFALPKAIEWPTQRNVNYVCAEFPPEMNVVEKEVEGAGYFLYTAGCVKGGGRLTFQQIFECDSYPFELSSSEPETNPPRAESLKPHLQEENGIEVNSSRIRQLAKSLVRENAPALENAERIYKWVRTNISYCESHTTPRSAVAVLDKRQGDCASFSILIAALARAAGIPTRIVAGFQKNPMGNLHIWDECYLERRGWIPVDGAGKRFGYMPAGYIIMSKGSHLRLHHGKYMTPQIFQIYCFQYEVSQKRPKVTYTISISPVS